ncbi:MAG TPA: DUF2383 domain-containing protein [Pseudobdellovibrionaceae bacterium]|nr:DUF2383 domain-containing protein [Pseudobdellovibrionaceae bacterium]
MDYGTTIGTVGAGAIGTDIGDKINKILRGELSAIEAYDQVLESFSEEPETSLLLHFRTEHEDSVRQLKPMVQHEGHEPSEDSGVWGTVVAAVVGTGKLFGNHAALVALKEGEERGLEDYESLLQEDELGAEDRDVIRNKLIPRQEKHIALLNQMASMQ